VQLGFGDSAGAKKIATKQSGTCHGQAIEKSGQMQLAQSETEFLVGTTCPAESSPDMIYFSY
jgi:hypothetical protein